MFKFIKRHYWYLLCVACVLSVAFFIRFHNLFSYNSFWADDGGAHVAYVEKLINFHSLPNLQETYLAWHEPLYYVMTAFWGFGAKLFGFYSLNFLESFNILVYLFFLILVWIFTYLYSEKNKWLALLNLFIFSFIFVGVKLSAYINDEVLAHSFIFLLLILFWKFDLFQARETKKLFHWSLILAFAILIKMSVLILLLAALCFWGIKFLQTKNKNFIKFIFLSSFIVCILILPWFIYKKQTYHTYSTLNIYNNKPAQNILTSDAWLYFFSINKHAFIDYPYWFSQPQSYFVILFSDTFGDYYNLFNNVVNLENSTDQGKILVGNGRYTTTELFQTMLNINRWSLFIVAIIFFGFINFIYKIFQNKKIKDSDLFLCIFLFGGWSALLIYNLRLPYLEMGVLKAYYIFFTYPILALLAYKQLWQLIPKKIIWFILAFLPWLLYIVIAWRIFLVDF